MAQTGITHTTRTLHLSAAQTSGTAQSASRLSAIASFTLVNGGDEFLNSRTVRSLVSQARRLLPQADVVDLDAAGTDRYTFSEAVSPSLLSQASIVILSHFEASSDQLFEAITDFIKKSPKTIDPSTKPSSGQSIVIASRSQGQKGSGLVKRLTKTKARVLTIPPLKYDADRASFARAQFVRRNRRIYPNALQELVAVMGSRTGELAAMCDQLCDDTDENPISLRTVASLMDDTAEATGFEVADAALAGQTVPAVIHLRQALARGTQPVAIVGALASKLHQLALVAAVQAGTIDEAEAQKRHVFGWAIRKMRNQLHGWTSEGLTRTFEALAHADETAKGVGGDPNYELERAVELICRKGAI